MFLLRYIQQVTRLLKKILKANLRFILLDQICNSQDKKLRPKSAIDLYNAR